MDSLRFLSEFFYSQLFVTPPMPSKSWRGKTVIVTGGNMGLGFEAAKHIAALAPEKLIITSRSQARGDEAKRAILAAVPGSTASAIEAWELDLGDYDSVKAFAKRAAADLPRIDSLIEGAGFQPAEFEMLARDEKTLTVNVVSTFLLALLMLPQLRETARLTGAPPTLPVVASELGHVAAFPERRLPQGHVFAALNDPSQSAIADRYPTSKLLQIMLVRLLARRLGPETATPVIVCAVNPGMNVTNMTTSAPGLSGLAEYAFRAALSVLGRRADVGARTYVLAAESGPEVHGRYLSNGVVARAPSAMLGTEGEKLMAKVWAELADKLEDIAPGVMQTV